MSRHLHDDLEYAKRRLLELSGVVEQMIQTSMLAMKNRDAALMAQVIATDTQVDADEVRIESECLKILALHQPVAADLRRITSMLKINNDLERIGDLSCNIAERADRLRSPVFSVPSEVYQMAAEASEMVRHAMDAFVNENQEQANNVIQRDDEIDRMNRDVIEQLTQHMRQEPSQIEAALSCFSIARHLEQIADHATNIASDLIYMVSGQITRHAHNLAPHTAPET